MKISTPIVVLLILCLVLSCNNDGPNDPIIDVDEQMDDDEPQIEEMEDPEFSIVNAFPDISFVQPVDLQSPADGTDRIFVLEQRGRIHVFPNDPAVTETNIYLNIENIVQDGGERGLLGLAFHPNFDANGYFYVNYTNVNAVSVVSRFQQTSTDQNLADAQSELVLLEIPQPFSNHNGGQLTFGPDGYLYIASGDGGSGGDPQGNAQNRSNLLGAILRIDVDNPVGNLNYGIPEDNPYVGSTSFRQEIFAFGLRNPWRMSFDTQTGLLWAGDVGQNEIEEIDIIENGQNYGWNILEGTRCFDADECNTENLTLPVFEYDQLAGDKSITGGYVYRGSKVTSLAGKYVYGDFISGRIWALDSELNSNLNNILLMNSDINVSSFGTDNNMEMYICGYGGNIYTFAEN